jgi:hypothetical protein
MRQVQIFLRLLFWQNLWDILSNEYINSWCHTSGRPRSYSGQTQTPIKCLLFALKYCNLKPVALYITLHVSLKYFEYDQANLTSLTGGIYRNSKWLNYAGRLVVTKNQGQDNLGVFNQAQNHEIGGNVGEVEWGCTCSCYKVIQQISAYS